MSCDKLPLRILYSLNGSPQYILARSPGPVPVHFIPPQGNSGASSSRSTAPPSPSYASASLKTCLNTICRSSPEIIQDRTRDFTVYLLDPLETDCAPAQVHISHSNRPVPDVPEARVAVGLGLMSWALSAEETDAIAVAGTVKVSGIGQKMLEVIFSLRETVPMEKASLPDALRSWGQPASSSSQRSRSKRKSRAQPMKPPPIPVTDSDRLLLAAPNSYIGPERRPVGRPWRHRPPNNEQDEVVIVDGPSPASNNDRAVQDFIALIKALSPEVQRNKALGNVLGLVHGPDGTAAQPPAELANAMTLFSDLQRAPRPTHQPSSDGSQPFSQHRRRVSSTDDEIVVLNKENVNPTVFRRRAERDKADSKLSGSVEPTGSAALSSVPPSNTTSQIQTEVSRLVPSTNQPPRRKRTLSEFMEEHESAREKEKAQKKAQYYRQPERSMSMDSLRQAASTAISTTNMTQDAPGTISSSSSPGKQHAALVPPKPKLRSSASASSPVRPARKKYVVPTWARTETATQPRLSERVIHAAKLKEQEEAQRKKEARRKPAREEKGRLKDGKNSKAESTEKQPSARVSPPMTGQSGKAVLPPLMAASGEFPMFNGAVKRTPADHSEFVRTTHSPSRATSLNCPPRTPPRKCRANLIATPDAPDSLFTPASGSWEAEVLNSGRAPMSPSSRKASTPGDDKPQIETDPDSDDDLLGQELDSAFDDFDFPPSSLPIASSEADADPEVEPVSCSSQDYDSDESDDDAGPPKQHWVGLPPSSPPPPSSPYLTGGQMDDEDVEEVPLATSDGADLGPESETLNSPDTEATNYSVEELGKLLNIDGLADFFPSSTDIADTALLFEQFTNHIPSSDDSSQTVADWGSTAANPEFDLSEFWESVRPLVQGTTSESDDPGLSDMGSIDPAKLAGDVHALFSGCLV
ncbi:hypothetical protein B0H15DRAFT_575515 [Mycena belliarum]|uniref:Uncharacterized protein n=1 Tax=Mycena belliarum TaxID=1033014 RepID=A0AAD6TWG1_9AGAR|nr:hypothetical protein B0H15DRAFT_575515 [Mycena belliae]